MAQGAPAGASQREALGPESRALDGAACQASAGRPMTTWEQRIERGFPLAIVLVALVGAVGWGFQHQWIQVGAALVIAVSLGWMAVS